MSCDEAPILKVSEYSSKDAGRPRLSHNHRGRWNEMERNEWVWRSPLRSRDNIVASHLAGPDSNPGWINFPGWGFFQGFSLTVIQYKCRENLVRIPFSILGIIGHRHHHQSVLPKGRSFTANSDTKAAILPKGRSSTAISGIKNAVLLGINMCGSFLLLSAPHSLFSIWTDLKRSQGHQRGAEESGFG